jgi:cellulose synthase/poly-beta-1,6-N-acetylglucosamine synthase-like glycosyltransferase
VYYHCGIIHFLKLDKEYSFAKANNIAFRYAVNNFNPDIIVFINSDTIVDDNWLQYIAECFENPKVGVCGCNIRSMDGSFNI